MAESGATHEIRQSKSTEQPQDDEDYMGDLSKFLPAEPSHKPKKPHPETSNSPHPSKKKNPRAQNLDRKKQQLQEDEQTLENLKSAIPQSNIGFKLLKQMGYTPGSALGKGNSGRTEPIGLEIRRTRAGIGRADPVKEKLRIERDRVERKRRNEEELMEEFGSRQKLQWRSKRIVVNYRKAMAALDQLENRELEMEVEKGGDEEGETEEEEEITEEDLQEILVKLRDEHCYCLFCGCQYESTEALLSNCPGINEDDH